MATTTADRLAVLEGIVMAAILSGAFIGAGMWLTRGWHPPLPWSLSVALTLAALPMIAGIGWAARLRHFAGHIDGSPPEAGSPLDLTLRFVTNTTERLVLFATLALAASEAAPLTAARLLPIMPLWFVIARALSYAGYRANPLARAVGSAATFYPSIALALGLLIALARAA